MSKENGKYPTQGDGEPGVPVDESRPSAEAGAEGTIPVDEPDEPVNPDEKTRAEITAARHALSSPRMGRRPYKGPRSIAIMLLVVGMIIFMGAYAISWALRLREQNQKGDLRKLEEREVMST